VKFFIVITYCNVLEIIVQKHPDTYVYMFEMWIAFFNRGVGLTFWKRNKHEK
jgi:hypothetical protein